MAFENNRNVRDKLFSSEKAFPAANATATTDIFDLEMEQGGILDNIEAEIVIPALANNVDNTKTILVALHDSADGTNFTVVDPLTQTSVAGVASTGSAAKTVRFRFPPITRRYVRLLITVPTGAGDNTAAKLGWNLLF